MNESIEAAKNKIVKIFIAEDHELTRMGLRFSIQDNPAFELAGESADGLEALNQIQALKPDLVLMDIGLPSMNGIESTRIIKQTLPEIKVIMLTSQGDQENVFKAFSVGADGYCLKDIKLDKLFQVAQMVYEGGIWLDPPIADFIIHRATKVQSLTNTSPLSNRMVDDEFGSTLTEREFETLTLIVAGNSNKEIAQRMGVSMNTIKTYVGKIIQKMAVEDRTQAAVKALRSGMVVPKND